jgi:hypothetical protein
VLVSWQTLGFAIVETCLLNIHTVAFGCRNSNTSFSGRLRV